MSPVRTGTKGIAIRVLALIAAVSLLTLSLGAGTALASGGRDSRNAENTFTKYATTEAPVPPVLFDIAGVVGGDVGDGTYAGEVFSLTATSTTLTIDAAYHFNGSRHSSTALVMSSRQGSRTARRP